MRHVTRALLAAAVLSALPLTASAQTAAAPGGRKPRIAILDFEYATVYSNVAAIFGSNIDVGKGVSDLLVNYLVKDGSYSIIERRALDKILAEQNFSNSDRADATSAAKIGKMLGVDAILVGSITQFGNDTKNTNIGGVGGGLGRVGLGGVGRKESKAIVGLSARLINVDTGEILAVAEGMGESKRSSTSLTGGGGGWGGFGGGTVDFGNSNFQNTIIGEAVKAVGREAQRRCGLGQEQRRDAGRRDQRPRRRRDRLAADPERRRQGRREGRRSALGRARRRGDQGSGHGPSHPPHDDARWRRYRG